MVAREAGRLAGLDVACSVFTRVDPRIQIERHARDGMDVAAGTTLATIEGPARGILTAERTALNILGRMCGIATATRQIAKAIEHTGAHVVGTRKTTPTLRALEKYAVKVGGGANHRFGLDDAVLIKDNHIAIAGGVRTAVERARKATGHMVKIELEVDRLDQLAEALELGVDVILLDNMPPDVLREAVAMVDGRAITEASGGINPKTAPAIAEAGVDLLSVGYLTHSAPTLDVALDIDPPERG
jgi:nicotinate-nucleotide pyrophosphorylase (carboxylating)